MFGILLAPPSLQINVWCIMLKFDISVSIVAQGDIIGGI